VDREALRVSGMMRIARRLDAPVFAWWILGTWIAFVFTYPTGPVIILAALVGFFSLIIFGALGVMLMADRRYSRADSK
jgi:hypothetical protein